MPLISPLAAAAPSQRAPSDRPGWQPLRRAVRVLLGLILLAASLLLIAWLTLHWGILPRIEQWRPQIEARASAALGVPVRIGSIEASSSGWVPAIQLSDVRLLDAAQRPVLQLPRVAAALSPRSLLSFELRFAQLLIEGAQLEIRRDAQGRMFVAGLDVSAAGQDAADGALRDWFFEQHEFVVRNGSVRWIDERRAAPPLALEAVDLVVRNGLLQHELRLDATPDAVWGERFSLRGRFTQPLLARAGDWRRWIGAAFVEMPRVDVRELRRHVDLPFELSQGEGAVRAWFDLAEGRVRSATVDAALRDVALRLGRSVEAMDFDRIEGRFVAQRSDEGVALAAQRFGFVTGDGITWPQGDLKLAWRQRGDGPVTGGEFSAQRLDLALMAQIAARVPLGDALATLLAELRPEGIVDDLSAGWQGPLAAPTRYQVKAGLQGLTLAARPAAEPHGVGRPGLRNANLQVGANESGGTARLVLDAGELEFPGVFAEPVVSFDALAATIAWKIEPAKVAGAAPKVSVQVKDTTFANADAQGGLDALWSTGPGVGVGPGGRYPGQLELNGRITRGAADRVARYLPLGLPESRHYLERAASGGTISAATFRVKGDLRDFPYRHAKSARDGEFRINGKIDDLAFAYVPDVPASGATPASASPWPAFAKVGGELVIDRNSLEIRNARAQWGGVVLGGVNGSIRQLGEGATLTIAGAARGPLGEMLRFVDASPVGQWTGRALAGATGAGHAELKLSLAIPLADTDRTTVKGSVVLPGNDLRLTPEIPLLANTRGRVDFTHQGFAVAGATARVLGGDVSFDGGSQPDGAVRFDGQGMVSAEGLRRATELGPVARAALAMSGQTSYRLALGFVHGHTEFNLTSNLVGLGLDLPAPLKKTADAPLPLRVQTQLVPESLQPGQTPRDSLRIELGNTVQAIYAREFAAGTTRVLHGGIGVFDAAPAPREGVAANINLVSLDVDDWEAAADRLFGAGSVATARARGEGPDPSGSGYVPDRIALRVQALHSGSRQFNRAVAGISRDGSLWRANVDAEQLNGYLEYRAPRSSQGAGRLYARLARLSLPKSDAEQFEALLDQQLPTTVPALDIVVDDFELRGKRLGRLEIEAVNRSSGEGREAVREWLLNRFSISVPEAQLSGSGSWSEVGGTFLTVPGAAATVRRRAVLNFKLDMNNGGALLERLGTGQAIRGGKGSLAGQLSWLGSPLALDHPSLAGNVAVAVDAGQFLKVDPGAARLLGVLSLQSLPRRLALDFRDVFQEGFAFDNVTGDLKITNGVAQTNNLRMRGVQAVVLMEGSADIAHETQDLRVVVVPEINAGTASLAYAVINPAIGLGTFLAQALLRKPLAQAGTREFHVTGPWADPKVEKIERKFDDAPTDGEAGTIQNR